MAQFELLWNPAKPYSTEETQQVEYKRRSDLSYSIAATIPDFKDHYLVTGLEDNIVYDFRVTCSCDSTSQSSQVVSFVNFTCPVLNTNRTDDSMLFSFTPANVDSYMIILYQDGVYVDSETFNGPFFGDIAGSFTGLNLLSQYLLSVVITQDDMSAICNNGVVDVTCTIIMDMNIS